MGFNVTAPGETMRLIRLLVKKSQKNYSDKHGYSYLHGACMAGDGEKVRRFMSEGVGVDLDSYECSALHVTAQYRSRDIVKILLDKGADPNQRDLEGSTPLHALAWPCLDEFATGYRFCDRKKPVDRIVDALLKKGADIEARNRHGDTPLQSASSCFDVDLVKCLLEHGASFDGLNEYRIFSRSFTTLELKNYPLILNMIEVVQSLQSAGYRFSYWGRRRMLKCWVKIRGNDTDHLLPICS
uniref:Uncharacterized protein n=1 Tax=Trichogramma kaykai TaxID=54128 RepID=A0ABD2X7X8_9HYME